ncbi:CpaD family pilus assembly lipoprotein [Sneathiella aquimaris]|uniref:CpaD family pilus assembly lipoprotein n=1 Tax=Sneathiella aquimaris TaxID=2599305 RepID=UPI00146E22F9|nr:CpaD family pilus assembly lipoprotein [Sneathiella aquimaris]
MMSNTSKFSKKAGLIGLGLLALGACAPTDPVTGEKVLRANPENSTLNKQINVSKVTPTFVVNFPQNDDVFSDLEKGRLLGFLEAQGTGFGDALQVELPPFSDSAGINEARFGAIGSFLQDQGFVVEPKLARDGLENSLRVYYTKYVATVDPDCAKGWRRPEGTNYENLPLPHMGCSTASSLAQMIADPKDLVDPKTMGAYDGHRAAQSILKYRSGGKSAAGKPAPSGGKK